MRLFLRVAAASPRLLAPPISLLHSLILSEIWGAKVVEEEKGGGEVVYIGLLCWKLEGKDSHFGAAGLALSWHHASLLNLCKSWGQKLLFLGLPAYLFFSLGIMFLY